MSSRELPNNIAECNSIIRKCRTQIAQANGMKEACRLIKVGETIDEVEASAYDYKRRYNARLNEVLAHRAKLQQQLELEDDYD